MPKVTPEPSKKSPKKTRSSGAIGKKPRKPRRTYEIKVARELYIDFYEQKVKGQKFQFIMDKHTFMIEENITLQKVTPPSITWVTEDPSISIPIRKRPDFTSQLRAFFNQTHGGTYHRRHIVMSSLLRKATYKITDSNNIDNVRKCYQTLLGLVNYYANDNDLASLEQNIVKVLHNNPANLIIDQGHWNSAIGALAHNVEKLLEKDINEVAQLYTENKQKFFDSLAYGFQVKVQKKILDVWYEYDQNNPCTNTTQLSNLLGGIYDNAAFDLMSTISMPTENNLTSTLLKCHQGFNSVASSGDIDTFSNVASTYIKTGISPGYQHTDLFNKTTKITYKDVL